MSFNNQSRHNYWLIKTSTFQSYLFSFLFISLEFIQYHNDYLIIFNVLERVINDRF